MRFLTRRQAATGTLRNMNKPTFAATFLLLTAPALTQMPAPSPTAVSLSGVAPSAALSQEVTERILRGASGPNSKIEFTYGALPAIGKRKPWGNL